MVDKYTVETGINKNFDDDSTWTPINIRSAAFSWTASGSGTGEYYLRTAGGANPTGELSGLVEPANVQANSTALTAGTAGSLSASEWDWADNDTLGYSTIYVRMGDDTDPDSKADGYVTFTDSPKANDNVFFRGSPSIVGGDFSDIELDDVTFLPGFGGAVGSSTRPLKIDMGDANSLTFSGSAAVHLSVGSAAVSPIVSRTANASNGQAGLYLYDCSALNDLFNRGGTTKLINCSVDDAYVLPGASLIGDASSDCTADLHNNGGTLAWDGTGVDAYTAGGTTTINGTDAWAVVECSGGTVQYNGSGTITAAAAVGSGAIDFTKSSVGQTVTTLKIEGRGKAIYDPADTTISNAITGDGPRVVKGGIS